MKTNQWYAGVFIFVCLLQTFSCTKTVDTTTNDSIGQKASIDATVANEFSDCKLRRIVHSFGGDPNSPLVNGLFTYNADGNPYSLTYGSQIGTGNPNHYFYYDNQKRLKEWREALSPDNIAEAIWHKYGYNTNDVIIVDTTIIHAYGTQDITVSTLTYDGLGRIVKEKIRNIQNPNGPLRPTRNPTYTYDNRGNLGVLGWKSSWYDTKVSFLRSHPLFMFLTRNYSRNNPYNPQAAGRKYNSRKLPLSLNAGNDLFFNTVNIEKFIYDCQ